jgi:hypothetical protein
VLLTRARPKAPPESWLGSRKEEERNAGNLGGVAGSERGGEGRREVGRMEAKSWSVSEDVVGVNEDAI